MPQFKYITKCRRCGNTILRTMERDTHHQFAVALEIAEGSIKQYPCACSVNDALRHTIQDIVSYEDAGCEDLPPVHDVEALRKELMK